MQEQQKFQHKPHMGDFHLKEELDKYIKYWPWFIIGVLICLGLAFVYLRYTTPIYNTISTIIVKDENKNARSSEMTAFADLGLLSGMGTNSIENEIGILKSRRLMAQVVQALNTNIKYYMEGNIRTIEVYNDSPILVNVLKSDPEKLASVSGINFKIEKLQGGGISITNEATEKVTKAKLGVPMNLGFANVVFIENNIYPKDYLKPGIPVTIQFSTVNDVVDQYRPKIQVELTDKNASLIQLNLEDPVKEKAQDILDQLIIEYNQDAIEDKNLIARNTAKFIGERLDIINEELDSVETGKQEFKQENQLTDIQAESQMFIENASDYKKQMQEVGTQLELANAMIDYLNSGSSSDLLPANLGISESGVNQLIEDYNNLVLQRNRILSGSTEKNPVVVRLNSQIGQLKQNVMQSLQRMRSNLKISEEDLYRQASSIGYKISSVPGKERKYRGIERQQNIKEELYLFLLQKREENSLSLAVTSPKAKIVDSAYTPETVSPNSQVILLGSLLLGLFIPFVSIYSKNLLSDKVKSRNQLEKWASAIPIAGEIPKLQRKESEIISINDRSVIAEAFRSLVTNIQYFLVKSETRTKGFVLCVTSSIKGEGKTFTSANLAITMANNGNKVLLVGADLRNPQLKRYEKEDKGTKGLSDYLANYGKEIETLIRDSKLHPNLQILPSGSIPPNPSELLRMKKMENMLKELQEVYDYIILDTAPAMLVTDTFLVNRYADLSLYVIRAGFTEKKLLNFALDSKNKQKLEDTAFILNDVKLANFGYGSKYGYIYGQEKEGFWTKFKRSF